MIETPFEMGKTYWLPWLTPHKVELTCPVCYGQRAVTVVLGNGEQVGVLCDGCGIGLEGPSGVISEYSHEPGARPFTVVEITSMHQGSWSLRSKEGEHANWDNLYATEAEALTVSQQRMAEQIEDKIRRQATMKESMLKKKTWTVRYHEQCIADLERQLAWHRAKVSERKAMLEGG